MVWEKSTVRLILSAFSLAVSCLVYLHPLNKRPNLWPRLAAMGVAGVALSALGIWLWSWNSLLTMSLSYLFVLLFFTVCADVPMPDAIYCGAWALISQQLMSEIAILLHQAGEQVVDWPEGLWLVLTIVLYAAGYVVIGLTVARWMPQDGRYDVGPRQFTAAMVLLVLFEMLCMQVLFQWSFSQLLYPVTLLLAQFYCATMLYLQRNLFLKSAMQQELYLLNHLRYEQKEQYRLAQETIDIINRKCHDLKHQMAAMRCISDPAERERHLDEIQQSVQIYDSIFQTGNSVLDTVLTEKSLHCGANGITLHCIADGHLLDFMDPVDLYGVLGNGLDNAIESVQGLQEAEKRFIDVLLCAEQQFTVLSISNPVQGSLRFHDGLPLSTKPSDGYHGFGLKSIRHTVEKYGGCLNASEEHGCFVLRIMIPRVS
jgi:hypothetical protein